VPPGRETRGSCRIFSQSQAWVSPFRQDAPRGETGEESLELKGDRKGLRCLAYGYSDEEQLLDELEEFLGQQRPFLGASRLFLEVDLPLTPRLLAGAADIFQRHPPLALGGVHQRGQERPLSPVPDGPPAGALVVRSSLRSGQVVEHAGDVVVLGDVKPGARVISGGDVFVLGRLQGMALAGQPERSDARVYALRFEPSQVRIGIVLAVPSGDPGTDPEYASIEDGQIVVMAWTGAPGTSREGTRKTAY
jgi:septum site-determining protein MinC